MLYLFGAGVLITANRTYPSTEPGILEVDSELWRPSAGEESRVEMYEEINKGDDELKSWLTNNRDSLPFDDEVVPEHINRKIARGKRHVYRLGLLILYHTGHALRMCQWKPLPLPQLHPHGATNSSLAPLICPDRGF